MSRMSILFGCWILLSTFLFSYPIEANPTSLQLVHVTTDSSKIYEQLLRRVLAFDKKGTIDHRSLQSLKLSAWKQVHVIDFMYFLNAYLSFDLSTCSAYWERTMYSMDSLRQKGIKDTDESVICGDIYLKWGMLYGAMGQSYKAFRFLQKAKYYSYRYFSQGTETDQYNNRTIALLQLLFANVPDKYKWLLPILGLQGDAQKGVELIQQMLALKEVSEDTYFKRSTQLLYGLTLVHLGTKKESLWQVLDTSLSSFDPSGLFCYISVVRSIRTGDHDSAFKQLKAYKSKYGAFRYKPLGVLYAQLMRPFHVSKMTTSYTSLLTDMDNRHFQKTIYFHLALLSSIKGDFNKSIDLLRKVVRVGERVYYQDKVAYEEANYLLENGLADHRITQSRLLYDAGLYQQSIKNLDKIQESDLLKDRDKIALAYRYGQNLLQLNRPDEAKQFFTKVCSLGSESSYHYVCNAWCQLARIYKDDDNKKLSLICVRNALEIDADLFKDALHEQAKKIKKEVENTTF